MSVIIKSDQTAVNTIGNIYGLNGALDFSILLDFNQGLYRYADGGLLKDINLADAITLTRTTNAGYKDRDGISRVAILNEPRIHFMQDLGVSGLLIEPVRENLLLNPDSPTTQTISVPTAGAKAISLSIEGTGSATMSGDVEQLNRASATQGNPQGALPVGATTASVTVTITGNVTRFQLEICSSTQGGSFASSFIPSGQTTRAADGVMLSNLLSDKLGAARTVVCQFAYHERLVKNFSANINIFSLENTAALEGGLYVQRTLAANIAGTAAQKVVAYQKGSVSIHKQSTMPSTDARVVTTALSYTDGGGDLMQAVNGMVKSIDGDNGGFNINTMTLGGKQGFTTITGEAGGVLTRLAVFDRKLTDDELENLSTSWL